MQNVLVGIDLGGTKLAIGLITPDGKIIDKLYYYDHIDKKEDSIVLEMAQGVHTLFGRNDLDEKKNLMGIGVTFPGHLRHKEGICIITSNIKAGFRNYPLKAKLQEYFTAPVYVENDANAQAYAEYKYGAGKNTESIIFVTISTGIGAGIILDGKIYRGLTGTAGEIGHTIVDPDSSFQCTCGNYGCLMATACGRVLPKLYQLKLKEGKKSKIGITLENVMEKVDGKLLKNGFDEDDTISKEIIYTSAEIVGISLYNLSQILNIPTFVLGGGLMNWGEPYMHKIKEKFHTLAKDMAFDDTQILTSNLWEDAGIIGAAALYLEENRFNN